MTSNPWEDLPGAAAALRAAGRAGPVPAGGQAGSPARWPARARAGRSRPWVGRRGHGGAVALLAGAGQLVRHRHAGQRCRHGRPGQIAATRSPVSRPSCPGRRQPGRRDIDGVTRGRRLADLGAIERRMAKVMKLWLGPAGGARLPGRGGRRRPRQMALTPSSRLAAGRQNTPQPKDALELWLHIANRSRWRPTVGRFLKAQGELLRHWISWWPNARWSRRWWNRRPADAHRDRRGAPLGPGAQAAGEGARRWPARTRQPRRSAGASRRQLGAGA